MGKEKKDFEWLDKTIDGLLNDFESGVSDKEETKNGFFMLIFDELVKQIQNLQEKD